LSRKIIVFAPHPDDETLGCGGTIAKKVSENYEVIIAVMTDGKLGLSVWGINTNPTPEELKSIRKKEVIGAAAILGVPKKNLVFFDFADMELLQNKKEVEERVGEILKKELPTEIYFPCEKDWHIDHQAANSIVSNSARRLSSSALRFQYSIARTRRKYSRLVPFTDRLLNIFKHNLVTVDVTEFLPLKSAAIREFKSQIAIVPDSQRRPWEININRYLRSKEVFYVE
jgi:LmbE family N-acetylglucosaminyl deacetylase